MVNSYLQQGRLAEDQRLVVDVVGRVQDGREHSLIEIAPIFVAMLPDFRDVIKDHEASDLQLGDVTRAVFLDESLELERPESAP